MTMSSRHKIGCCHKRAWQHPLCWSLLYLPLCPYFHLRHSYSQVYMYMCLTEKEFTIGFLIFAQYFNKLWWFLTRRKRVTAHVCGAFMCVEASPNDQKQPVDLADSNAHASATLDCTVSQLLLKKSLCLLWISFGELSPCYVVTNPNCFMENPSAVSDTINSIRVTGEDTFDKLHHKSETNT